MASCDATSTTAIYTLSLHDALPICLARERVGRGVERQDGAGRIGVLGLLLDDPELRAAPRDERRIDGGDGLARDRKSTRLNSSHVSISYAVFRLNKKMNRIFVADGD